MAVAATAKKQAKRPDTGTFKSAIVIDAATGNILFEEKADDVSPPASMTKLMTYAVLHDKLSERAIALDTPVRISTADSKIGGTQVYLDPRETFPVEELIYAMMIQSANDASYALARAAAGSVPAFVELMNAKAKALGMTNTTFQSPHGLPPSSRNVPDGDLTTPRDFALLSQHLLQHTNVLKYTAIVERPFGTGVRAKPMEMRNHNKLVGKVTGVDGLKTGFTSAAGYCLTATAERNGRRVIMVIMGSFGPNRQIDKGRSRDLKAIELIERGFAALPMASAVAATSSSAPSLIAPAPIRPAPTPAATPAPEPTIKFSVPKR